VQRALQACSKCGGNDFCGNDLSLALALSIHNKLFLNYFFYTTFVFLCVTFRGSPFLRSSTIPRTFSQKMQTRILDDLFTIVHSRCPHPPPLPLRPHPPRSRIHTGPLVSSVSDQASCLRRDHDTQYYPYYFFYPRNPVYTRRVESSSLVFSLSSHRQSYAGLIFRSRFLDS
jgi:hypothetical protein